MTVGAVQGGNVFSHSCVAPVTLAGRQCLPCASPPIGHGVACAPLRKSPVRV